jgi:hypothetical protein
MTPTRAMRIVLGLTTKDEILAFCPRANVGVSAVDGVENQKDIRWVTVPHLHIKVDEMQNDGDWIVQKAPDQFYILSDEAFHREYVIA